MATSGGKTHALQQSPSSFQTSQVTSSDPDGMPPFRVVLRLLERDDFSSNRHPALAFCLSMISAQTRSALVARENRCPLFRIMLYRLNASHEHVTRQKVTLRL